MPSQKISFEAEIIEVKSRKTASNDKEFRVILLTDFPNVLQLEKYIAEKTVNVEIK